MTEAERKREKRLIYKNVLLISFSFLLLFVAFESMAKLQSSINAVSRHNHIYIISRLLQIFGHVAKQVVAATL